MSAALVALLADDGTLDETWPFVRERLRRRLEPRCTLRSADTSELPLAEQNLGDAAAILWFAGDLTSDDVAGARLLRVVGGISDGARPAAWPALVERGIPFIDVTRAWARRSPSAASRSRSARCAESRSTIGMSPPAANGGTTRNSPTMRRMSTASSAQNASAWSGWVRSASGSRAGAQRWERASPATTRTRPTTASPQPGPGVPSSGSVRRPTCSLSPSPPTPTAVGMIDARLVDSLRTGALVVTVTRTAAIDCDALRRRVLDGSLAWAADVFDVEPLPPADPLRGRSNVVHIPHIAGRTRDANLRVADLLADDVLAVWPDESRSARSPRPPRPCVKGRTDDARGIVGAGAFAQSFIPLFQAHPAVEEVALCDTDPGRLADMCAQHGIARAYAGFPALIESNFDAVALFTQHWTHAPLCIEALDAGKDVFTAVPPAVNVDELAALVAAVERSGRTYVLAETSYYYPQAVYCRERARAGDFGDIVHIEAEYLHDWSRGFYEIMQRRRGAGWRVDPVSRRSSIPRTRRHSGCRCRRHVQRTSPRSGSSTASWRIETSTTRRIRGQTPSATSSAPLPARRREQLSHQRVPPMGTRSGTSPSVFGTTACFEETGRRGLGNPRTRATRAPREPVDERPGWRLCIIGRACHVS